jgi:hypothetical protein
VTVEIPIPLPSATGWVLRDYVSLQLRSAAAAGSAAQVEFRQLDGDEMWVIDHAVVVCNSNTPTTVRWYAGSIADLALLDGSSAGNFDVADWPAGLVIQPTSSLIALWSGASAGAVGTVTLQARVLRRT